MFQAVHVIRNALCAHIRAVHPTVMYNVRTDIVDCSPDVAENTKIAKDAPTYCVHIHYVQRNACVVLTRSFHGIGRGAKSVHAVPRTKCITPPDVYVRGCFGLSQGVAFHVVILLRVKWYYYHRGVRSCTAI